MNTQHILKTLKEARELITSRKHWTTGTMAKFAEGSESCASFITAGCFCAVGAVGKSLGVKMTDEMWDYASNPVIKELANALQSDEHSDIDAIVRITSFNDNHRHTEVLALFDTAIKRLETQP